MGGCDEVFSFFLGGGGYVPETIIFFFFALLLSVLCFHVTLGL
jgi:hypothetical protein